MPQLVLATAGHIDHGKTALVRALTGVETDRLPEEKRRGISIELGYAPLSLGDGTLISIIDVPGHERFMNTMIAGAMFADAALLVVAADEGIRPQTLEHLEMISMLRIPELICALTKKDRISSEQIAERTQEIRHACEKAGYEKVNVVSVDSHKGDGISTLKEVLGRVRPKESSSGKRPFLFPIDRIFTRPGFGTIVTGTLRDREVRRDETLELFPSRKRATVRSLEIFGRIVEKAVGPTRLAINLSGISKEEVSRGNVLIRQSEFETHSRFKIKLSKKPPSQRLRVLYGMAELRGRVRKDELILKDPFPFRIGDRVVLRTESPPRTVGAATVLEPARKQKGNKPGKVRPPGPNRAAIHSLIKKIQIGKRTPPSIEELMMEDPSLKGALPLALQGGEIERVSTSLYYDSHILRDLHSDIRHYFKTHDALTFEEWKKIAQVSRKYAIPLLEAFDQRKITICRPDKVRIRGPNL